MPLRNPKIAKVEQKRLDRETKVTSPTLPTITTRICPNTVFSKAFPQNVE